ncbi:hypothetical protein [Aquimarina sp. BL5]|uniref:hypothetical protein n=1 Tax=Aquimarina sp. BL5 TaxID=1714860 RepID=UPI0011C3C87E|nr:hypothetical protein [Aquimarina sp. BL5]
MRKLIFTLWTLFWGLGFVFAQSNDQTLRDIRAEYKIIINNLSSYKKVNSDLEIQSTEGGEIIAYSVCRQSIKFSTLENIKTKYKLWLSASSKTNDFLLPH